MDIKQNKTKQTETRKTKLKQVMSLIFRRRQQQQQKTGKKKENKYHSVIFCSKNIFFCSLRLLMFENNNKNRINLKIVNGKKG